MDRLLWGSSVCLVGGFFGHSVAASWKAELQGEGRKDKNYRSRECCLPALDDCGEV